MWANDTFETFRFFAHNFENISSFLFPFRNEVKKRERVEKWIWNFFKLKPHSHLFCLIGYMFCWNGVQEYIHIKWIWVIYSISKVYWYWGFYVTSKLQNGSSFLFCWLAWLLKHFTLNNKLADNLLLHIDYRLNSAVLIADKYYKDERKRYRFHTWHILDINI